jgi:hypothetical protein
MFIPFKSRITIKVNRVLYAVSTNKLTTRSYNNKTKFIENCIFDTIKISFCFELLIGLKLTRRKSEISQLFEGPGAIARLPSKHLHYAHFAPRTRFAPIVVVVVVVFVVVVVAVVVVVVIVVVIVVVVVLAVVVVVLVVVVLVVVVLVVVVIVVVVIVVVIVVAVVVIVVVVVVVVVVIVVVVVQCHWPWHPAL